jgi:zona occludens toxin (predicted ATPase)
MKKKITILLVIFALIIVFYSYAQIHSTKINKTKNISIKKLTKTNINTIAYFTGLNYLYSINIESKIKNIKKFIKKRTAIYIYNYMLI